MICGYARKTKMFGLHRPEHFDALKRKPSRNFDFLHSEKKGSAVDIKQVNIVLSIVINVFISRKRHLEIDITEYGVVPEKEDDAAVIYAFIYVFGMKLIWKDILNHSFFSSSKPKYLYS